MTCTKAVSPQALPTGAGRRLSGGEDERRTVAPARRGRDGCGTANYTSERRSPCTLEAGGAERGVSRGGSGRPQPTGDRGDLRRCHLPEMSPLQTLTSTKHLHNGRLARITIVRHCSACLARAVPLQNNVEEAKPSELLVH